MLKILLLTPQIPYPPRQGASMRNYYIIKGLAENHQLTLLSFQEPQQDVSQEMLMPLNRLCTGGVHHVPVPPRTTQDRLRDLVRSSLPDMGHRLHSERFNEKLAELLHDQTFDVVQIEGIELARTMMVVREHSPLSKIVFDNHNAETELQRRALQTDWRRPQRWLGAAYSAVQVVKLSQFETWACETADAVTVVSHADAAHLQKLVPSLKPTPIPNSIDVGRYADLYQDPNLVYDLVFTGKMDYRPNVDAMQWFCQAIWPIIKEARPETTLAIVGQKPHDRLRPLADLPDVTLTGFVESVEPYLAGTKVVIMPLRMGSGTRLKFLQACAASKAIVSTPVGAEGFDVTQGKQVFLAEEPSWFAEYCLSLLKNPEGAEKLGREAHAFAQHYDWRVVVPVFETVYRKMGK